MSTYLTDEIDAKLHRIMHALIVSFLAVRYFSSKNFAKFSTKRHLICKENNKLPHNNFTSDIQYLTINCDCTFCVCCNWYGTV